MTTNSHQSSMMKLIDNKALIDDDNKAWEFLERLIGWIKAFVAFVAFVAKSRLC
jgi:hypothetical protein